MSHGAQGMNAWLVQRISAIYIALFLIYLLLTLAIDPFLSFDGWQEWMASPLQTITFSLFFIALLLHAWVGIRDVILDYIHPTLLRLLMLTLLMALLLGEAVWVFKILLGAG